MSLLLKGRTAIVTGSAGGLGKVIARAFLQAGANVVLSDIKAEALSKTAKEFKEYGSVLAMEGDITSEAYVEQLFGETFKKFGRIHILVNNAGIMDKMDPVGDLRKELWDRVLAVNLTAPFITSKIAVNHFLDQDTPNGVILNICSLAGVFGFRAGAAYTSSKHGLVGLTKNTAAFYGKKGIRCNALCAGLMLTDMANEASLIGINEDAMELVKATMAINPEACDLDEVANLSVYLCSEQSHVLNGACINMDRGWGAF